jgi:hypothetical protein
MIERVECPNPAYNKIIEAGIDKRLKGNEVLEDFISHRTFPDNIDRIYARAEKELGRKGKITEKREIARDILLFRAAYDEESEWDSESIESCSIEHPSLLAYLALGKDVFNFRELRFPTRRSLEESIASFCIGEGRSLFPFNECERIWRNGRFKNVISRNMHGDMYVGQTDVSGRYSKQRTLFGGEEEEFETKLVDPPLGAFGAYQDWSCFLLSLLRYAQVLGKEKMPEIANWREIAEKGGMGGNWGDGHNDFGWEWIMGLRLLNEGQDMKEIDAIFIPNGYGNHRIETIPYFSKDRKLVYRTDKGKKLVEYDEKDLPEALIANYCYFARDWILMCKIMEKFVEETK